jgi:hypothetical protein
MSNKTNNSIFVQNAQAINKNRQDINQNIQAINTILDRLLKVEQEVGLAPVPAGGRKKRRKTKRRRKRRKSRRRKKKRRKTRRFKRGGKVHYHTSLNINTSGQNTK